MPVKRYVIIVAGGTGVRMGAGVPKQFIELCGKPILMRTIDVFDGLMNRPEIIVVLPELQMDQWRNLCAKHNYRVKHQVTKGGTERFYSVLNGLELVDVEHSLVAIHDGVRPLVSPAVVEECYAMAAVNGSAIPVVRPVESIRMADGETTVAFPRDRVMLVQTPQVFQSQLIKRGYSQPYRKDFTDDASVLDASGETVFTVNGNAENIKITTPMDLIVAQAILQQ